MNISFEFFPPKTLQGQEKLVEVAQTLTQFQPHYFSVTFGAGGSTRQGTFETVSLLQEKINISTAPHLSCIGLGYTELVNIIKYYQSLGLKRIVALRGDKPSGMGKGGDMSFAVELVSLIRDVAGDYFHIEVAAYPECHPQAKSLQDDILNLKNKLLAGANSAITQYFYNPDAYFYFLDECAKQDIFMPIVPGIMPITNFAKLVQFSDACGAEIPRWLRKKLESYGDDQESIKALGLEVVYQLCQRLIAGGAPGLHIYTLNQSEASVALFKLLIEENMIPSIVA